MSKKKNKDKQTTTTRTISTTAKTSRKIYWPNIFAGFIFVAFSLSLCFGVLFYGQQINRCINVWYAFLFLWIFFPCNLLHFLDYSNAFVLKTTHFGLQYRNFGLKLFCMSRVSVYASAGIKPTKLHWHYVASCESHVFCLLLNPNCSEWNSIGTGKITHFFFFHSTHALLLSAQSLYNHFITCIFRIHCFVG